jgi:hypothetical protein
MAVEQHIGTVENERGVIAENYHELQGLAAIEEVREASPFEPGTADAVLLSLYQCAEIALYNNADLLGRAAADIAAGEGAACATKLSWVRDFHRVLLRLGSAAVHVTTYGQTLADGPHYAPWPIEQTPAFSAFFAALRQYDAALAAAVSGGDLDLFGTLSSSTVGDADFTVVHATRTANHDTRSWARALGGSAHPAPGADLPRLLSTGALQRAVREPRLRGDTYFTQFRALHQIPELLALEINDRLEITIRRLREGADDAALDALEGATELADPVLACLPPIVDNLSTADYHKIRENLGLTSGSHSVSLRFQLFTELYEQVCESIAEADVGSDPGADPVLRRLRRHAARLHTFIFDWRDMHLHLPRNNLGGAATKSLTGSPDAIRTVRKMRDNALSHDPMAALAADVPRRRFAGGALERYLDGPEGSDEALLVATGRVTQANFREVQERLGFFAQRCPFHRPPRRVVQ